MGFDYLRDNMAPTAGRQGPARPQLLHRRRGRLDPHRRGPHAADHLRPRRPTPPSSTTGSPRSCAGSSATSTTRSKRTSASSSRSRRASSKVEAALGVDNLYDDVQPNFVHQFTVALKAKELYKRDKDYIVQGGEVKIVDEFTGRILEGRRWSEGIHQAVEAKEGVKIKEENQTLATITLQNYFRMYDKLAGMTGTAQTEAAELMNTYGSASSRSRPTGRSAALDQADLIYKSEDRQVQRRSSTTSPSATRRASRSWSARSASRSREHLSRLLREARHRPRGAERQAAHPRGRDRRPGRPARCRHCRHQHGRPRRRHPPRRQPRDARPPGGPQGGLRRRAAGRRLRPPVPLDEMPEEYQEDRAKALARYEELLAELKVECARPRATRSASSAAST